MVMRRQRAAGERGGTVRPCRRYGVTVSSERASGECGSTN